MRDPLAWLVPVWDPETTGMNGVCASGQFPSDHCRATINILVTGEGASETGGVPPNLGARHVQNGLDHYHC